MSKSGKNAEQTVGATAVTLRVTRDRVIVTRDGTALLDTRVDARTVERVAALVAQLVGNEVADLLRDAGVE